MRLLFLLAALRLEAQVFEQRGFVELGSAVFPQAAANDSAHYGGEGLVRYEAVWRPKPWLKLQGGLDGRFDTHRQVEREFRLDWDDRRTGVFCCKYF